MSEIAGTSPDFGTERQYESGGEGSAVVPADANGDGSAGLVVSNTDDRASLCGIGEIAVLLNDGDGAVMPPVVTPFASAIPPNALSGSTRDVAVADLAGKTRRT